MIFNEPAPTRYDLNFVLFGFPVRVHPGFWLVGALLGLGTSQTDMRLWLMELVGWMFALFLAILIHELGHAVVMRRFFGAQPQIVLHTFGGLASAGGYYRRSPGTWGDIAISAAGPVAGFLSAAVVLGVLRLFGYGFAIAADSQSGLIIQFTQKILSDPFTFMIFQFIFISTIWGLVNLLPVYPLDGGRISRNLFMHFDRREGVRRSLILSIAVAGTMSAYQLYYWIKNGGGGFPFVALLFGYLAYLSYMMLQNYNQHRW
jgi:Zn-dependent protease